MYNCSKIAQLLRAPQLSSRLRRLTSPDWWWDAYRSARSFTQQVSSKILQSLKRVQSKMSLYVPVICSLHFMSYHLSHCIVLHPSWSFPMPQQVRTSPANQYHPIPSAVNDFPCCRSCTQQETELIRSIKNIKQLSVSISREPSIFQSSVLNKSHSIFRIVRYPSCQHLIKCLSILRLASPVPGIPTLSFWFLAIQRLEEEVMLP